MTYESDLILQRQQKDRFFKSHPQSPLMPEQRELFLGLQYFPPNPALRLELDIDTFAEKQNVKLLTTTGESRYYLRWGKVHFEVEGEATELTLYYSPGHDSFFLPFMDATTGTETYDAGRYIDAERITDSRVLLDFNLAYSPFCAFNEPLELAEKAGREPRLWSCPIPPQENRLKVAIKAGEKKPIGAWVISDPADH